MSTTAHRLEFAVCSNELESSRELAENLGGTLYADEREKWQHLPFRALVTCTTDNLPVLQQSADVGLYVICRRLIKPGVPTAVGLSTMVRHPDKSHEECDAHWRDVHAPLALVHHIHMSQYVQLSVVHNISGPSFDGFALCCFDSVDDLRNRFFATPESVGIITNDIKNFADTKNSPRRLITTVQTWAQSNDSK